jgi:hypothetical protein
MQETKGALLILINEMGNNIFILLCLFNRAKEVDKTIVALFCLTSTLFRGEVAVHTHQPGNPSHISVVKSSDEIYHS